MSFTLKPPQLLHLLQFSFRGTTGAPTISARQVLSHTLIAQSGPLILHFTIITKNFHYSEITIFLFYLKPI